MSSSGGGIVVRSVQVPSDQKVLSSQEGQQIVDSLRDCGHDALADKLVPIVADSAT